MNSFRFRILLLVALAVITAIVAVAIISSRVTRVQFTRCFLEDGSPTAVSDTALEPLRVPLETHFETVGNWQGSGPLVARLGATLADGRLLLFNGNHLLVAASDPELASAQATLTPEGLALRWGEEGDPARQKLLNFKVPRLVLLDQAGLACGTAVIVPHLPPDLEEAAGAVEAEQVFLGAVNRWLLAGTAGVGFLVLLATWIATRRLLRPVEQLTKAAGRMARGNLDYRVSVDTGDELGRLARTFNTMADNLARLETLRRNMVSDIAHELRTPLTSIRCQLEAVQDGLSEPSSETIDSIHEETLLLGRLVHDLQELAGKHQTGFMAITFTVTIIDGCTSALVDHKNGQSVTTCNVTQ